MSPFHAAGATTSALFDFRLLRCAGVHMIFWIFRWTSFSFLVWAHFVGSCQGGDPEMRHFVGDDPIRTPQAQSRSGNLPLTTLGRKRSRPDFPKGVCHRYFCATAVILELPFLVIFRGSCIASSHFGHLSFDQTLGYPGEGPLPSRMILTSNNVGSLQTNTDWSAWDSHITCLQETRVGKNNIKTATITANHAGFEPVFGQLLPGFIQRTGKAQTPCGGVAVLGPREATCPFDPRHDQTGLYPGLFASKRVVCAWVQIQPRRKALICSVYATTGASQDNQAHAENNTLFRDLFVFMSQFGSIPVIIAGDLQANPLSYPAISDAIHFHNWQDPLNIVDDQGDIVRPLTYSRDSLFSGPGDACSSIDAVLLNQQAFLALHSCEVVPTLGRQHRPIRCSFNWEVLSQVGFTLFKAAPFEFSGIPKECQPKKSCGAEDSPDPVSPEWETYWKPGFNLTKRTILIRSGRLSTGFAFKCFLTRGLPGVMGPTQELSHPSLSEGNFVRHSTPITVLQRDSVHSFSNSNLGLMSCLSAVQGAREVIMIGLSSARLAPRWPMALRRLVHRWGGPHSPRLPWSIFNKPRFG